ncbi:MAG: Gfo/Idh/MocA family oxidoreductase [Planctomycetes bacterium]|nr:Gfo/Idh/MocA family oxidoreductase [Planctomycetota bacterium]
MAKYRVGIIGCGGISKSHCAGWQAQESVEIVAGMDVSEENLKARCDEVGIPNRYTDEKEMLDKEDLDFVSICTWTGLHAPQTILCAEAGVKGILCEKPMSGDLENSKAMVDACEKSGSKLVIAHQRRSMSDHHELKQLIADGAIGDPVAFEWHTAGGLLNNGSHAVDTMRFLMDNIPVVWVVGKAERKTDRYERGVRIEDFCMIEFCFENGTRGLVTVDLPDEPEPPMKDAVLVGTEGMVRMWHNSIKVLRLNEAGWLELDGKKWNPHVRQAEDLIRWVEGGPEHNGSGRRVLPTMEVLMAGFESMRCKDIVKLPLEPGPSPLDIMVEDGTMPVEVEGKYDIRAKK